MGNLNSMMLRGQNCDDWVRNLTPLMCIEIVTTEVVFNSNTDNEITLVKLWKSYYYLGGGLH